MLALWALPGEGGLWGSEDPLIRKDVSASSVCFRKKLPQKSSVIFVQSLNPQPPPAGANKTWVFSLHQKVLAPAPRIGGSPQARRRNWQVKLLISNNFMVWFLSRSFNVTKQQQSYQEEWSLWFICQGCGWWVCWQVTADLCAGEEQHWTCPSEGPSKASTTLTTGGAPKARLSTAVRTQAVLLSGRRNIWHPAGQGQAGM